MTQVPSVPQFFEDVVARQPNAPAVESARGAYTYDALNRAANRIARAIVARRGDGEEPVALLFGKNAVAVAAMLGALKAGKFYVPLDASDPDARNALMLADSGAPLLLTDNANLARARARQ